MGRARKGQCQRKGRTKQGRARQGECRACQGKVREEKGKAGHCKPRQHRSRQVMKGKADHSTIRARQVRAK